MSDLHDDLLALGFTLTNPDRKGVAQYSKRASRYLTYSVHWNSYGDEALFTWELDIGSFMHDHGMQVGANDPLNIFLYPQYDARGLATLEFIAQELDRAESVLANVDLTSEPPL